MWALPGERDVSRSQKKVPIVAMTAAESDKRYKMAEHRRERAAVRAALAHGVEPASPRLFGDPCLSDKDGKQFVTGNPDRARRK